MKAAGLRTDRITFKIVSELSYSELRRVLKATDNMLITSQLLNKIKF
jgi:hypothetical protein